jgi:transposase InsO family protein
MVIDFMKYWISKTKIPSNDFVSWLEISTSKYYNWQNRYGKPNEHNGLIPRDHWLLDWEKVAICNYHHEHPLAGYRRLTFMMLDCDLVAVSPSSVYRVLKKAGLINQWNSKSSKKGSGFSQPLHPHAHWHIDISYLNLCGTFYYMCSIIDGYSRSVIHYEIRESMKESEIETIIQRAREKYPEATPRIISDNGPQFIAKDFKEFIKIAGMTHVRTAPYYPQSNGKIERYHRTIKSECIRKGVLLSLDDAREVVAVFVKHYNTVRLHSSIGYIAPADKLNGREQQIFKDRASKLKQARAARKTKRLKQAA